jgi:ketosteroid isomerase-like protein
VWTESFDDLSLTPRDVRDLGDTVLALAESNARVKDSGVPIRQPYGMAYSDFRDDKIGEVRFFFTWKDALASVGLQE